MQMEKSGCLLTDRLLCACSDTSCLNAVTVSSTPTVALQINDFGMDCFVYDALNCTGDQAKMPNTGEDSALILSDQQLTYPFVDWYNLDDLPGLSSITSLWCYQTTFC